jgi:UDP-GlcNAc3NAcA epimerase
VLKVVTVVGARPQFIKAAAVSRAIRSHFADRVTELLVHTGQHFDDNMSQVFFDELGIPAPDYHLAVSGGLHGAMTGRMMEAIEQILIKEAPDWVLVYGDTNSTLAGALAAAKLHIPIAHVEAGLRSFNMRMPEEVNRILTDRVSALLLCPTKVAVANLKAEGVAKGVHQVGDVMYDVAEYVGGIAESRSNVLGELGLEPRKYVLGTCHRAENTDDVTRLTAIVGALAEIARELPVVLPLHPRTRAKLEGYGQLALLDGLVVTAPVSYMAMVALEKNAAAIVTDSGGVQKEAFFYRVPCVTTRDETEWTETVDAGWNTLTGADRAAIVQAVLHGSTREPKDVAPYGSGDSAEKIVELILGFGK